MLAAVLAVAIAILLWLVLVKRRQWQAASGPVPLIPYTSRSQPQDTLCQQQKDLGTEGLQYRQLLGRFRCTTQSQLPSCQMYTTLRQAALMHSTIWQGLHICYGRN